MKARAVAAGNGVRGRARGVHPAPLACEREPLTGRRAWRGHTPLGTEVLVLPMPGFTKTYASVTTRFGSIDTHLPDGSRLPDGLAHFLEHKMFQTRQGDVFDLYAARGASANAYTTFDHTTYLFTCSSRFEENFDTLLDTMAEITTDPVGVAREKGIIGQEIAMYDDDPSWQGYFRLLQALYRRNPVRVDIAGTRATIDPIDPPLLQRTHAAFYHPANLIVVVAGDVDPEYVRARAGQRLVSALPGRRLQRRPVPEPARVAARTARVSLPVARSRVLLGWKDRVGTTRAARLKLETESALVLDLLFGEGGRVEAPLYAAGRVDESFGASYEQGDGFAFGVLQAEVDDPVPYRRALAQAVRRACRTPFTPAEVERARRKALGRHVRTFNAPEGAAHWLLDVALDGARLSDDVRAVKQVDARALTRRRDQILSAPSACSLVLPVR